jgi:hypothetical protein
MRYILIGIVLCLFVLCAGCVSEVALTQEQATIPIASLGGTNESFTLWNGEPGCCKEIYYYEKEADGAFVIRSVMESQSKMYFDSTPETARLVLMNGENNGYMTCSGTDIESVRDCSRSKSQTIFITYQFHVPKGTVIRPYGSPGARDSDDDNGINSAAYYSTFMSPSSPLSPIHITQNY